MKKTHHEDCDIRFAGGLGECDCGAEEIASLHARIATLEAALAKIEKSVNAPLGWQVRVDLVRDALAALAQPVGGIVKNPVPPKPQGPDVRFWKEGGPFPPKP